MSTDKLPITLRLEENLHTQLKAIAEQEHRSLNNLIEHFLLLQIEAYKNDTKNFDPT